MASDSNPPWYVTSADGSFHPGAIPDRLLCHPELQERGLVPFIPLKSGVVFTTSGDSPNFAIKILNTEREELAIYSQLLSHVERPTNHTVPFELTRTGHPLLIMPRINSIIWIHTGKWSRRNAMNIILQLVEGIAYLHSLHIVHMDMCQMNVMTGIPQDAEAHKNIVLYRLYIIDFDSSRQFALGPGVQPAVVLPETQTDKPNGLELLDPYSWDVYCVGRTLEDLMKFQYERWNRRPPWIAEKYLQWLIGNERGCPGVCRCRPTARTALRVIKILVHVVDVMEDCRWMARTILRLWPSRVCSGLKSEARKTS